MAKQIINTGTNANDRTGDTLRSAFTKINSNFTELYTSGVGAGGATGATGPQGVQGASGVSSGSSIDLSAVSQSIIPDTDVAYDLGAIGARWKDLHLSGGTIYLGNTVVSSNNQGGLIIPGELTQGGSVLGFNSGYEDGWTTSADTKTITFNTPLAYDWVLDPEIFESGVPGNATQKQAGYWNLDNRIFPSATFTVSKGGSNEIFSISIDSGGQGYADMGDWGPWRINPNRHELFTTNGVQDGCYGVAGRGWWSTVMAAHSDIWTLNEFDGTVSGSQTATGTFFGIDYSVTYGIRFIRLGNEGTWNGIFVIDEANTTITVNNGDPVEWQMLETALHINADEPTTLYAGDDDLIVGIDTPGSRIHFRLVTDKPWWEANKIVWPIISATKILDTTQIIGDLTVTGDIHVNPNSLYLGSLKLSTNDGSTLLVNDAPLIGTSTDGITRTVSGDTFNGTPTVIWSGLSTNITSVKMTIQIEGYETGDSSGWHTQVCEAIIADRWYGNVGAIDPQMTVYGVVHTSVAPLATFTVQRNPTSHVIELVATPTGTVNGTLYPKVHSVELGTRD